MSFDRPSTLNTPRREVTTHHDGLGLNDSIRIAADPRDPNAGGASHHYCIVQNGRHTEVQFQHGPRNVEGSVPGITNEVLLAIVIDRLADFQRGPFHCEENAEALDHIQKGLTALQARAHNRQKRGVLGTNER